jgi:acyl-CoA thioesterase FadM
MPFSRDFDPKACASKLSLFRQQGTKHLFGHTLGTLRSSWLARTSVNYFAPLTMTDVLESSPKLEKSSGIQADITYVMEADETYTVCVNFNNLNPTAFDMTLSSV